MSTDKSVNPVRSVATRALPKVGRPKRVPAPRRVGSESSQTRTHLLDAAEHLMRSQGYAAVTSRKVASEAQLTPQLVHYYFRTMDELFLALWRRFVDRNAAGHAQALASAQPLHALWNFNRQSADTGLEIEFIALAHHRKSIRKEIARDGDNFRRMQAEVLSRSLASYALEKEGVSAEIVSMLITSVCRTVVIEKDFGMSEGHVSTVRFVEELLDRLESRAARRGKKPAVRSIKGRKPLQS